MTDDTGIFQHAIFNVPNYREGYCTDDNARAFIFTLLMPEMTSRVAQQDIEGLASTYLSFLWDAFDQETASVSQLHESSAANGWNASVRRTVMPALCGQSASALGRSKNDGHRNLCALLFQRGLPVVEGFTFAARVGLCPHRDSGISAELFRGPDSQSVARVSNHPPVRVISS